MPAVSAPQATGATTTSESHPEDLNNWKFPTTAQQELSAKSKSFLSEKEFQPTNQQDYRAGSKKTSLEVSHRRANTHNSSTFTENAHLLSTIRYASNSKNSSVSESGSVNDSLLELYSPASDGMNRIDLGSRSLSNGNESKDEEAIENSRWIHRDKLARIENQELQAAGIIIPQARAASLTSSVRRKHSREMQMNNSKLDQAQKRQQVDMSSSGEEEAAENNKWDFRLPEEISESGNADTSIGTRSVSRIPVCVKSPLPIPMVHLERGTPLQRKKSGTWTGQEEGISYSKSRGRSGSVKEVINATPQPTKRAASESSKQKKPAVRNRSASAHLVSPQRPQTRSGPNSKRPSSRGNEIALAANKRPEGDPPWLSTMFKPDPRLPPDQQLIPTVAKRLQQEKWEKDGIYGDTYDTSFRPLNDRLLSSPPPPEPIKSQTPEKEPDAEWPLRSSKLSPPLSATGSGTSGGYSTMPKIVDPPPLVSPRPNPGAQPVPQQPVEVKKKKRLCGSCSIM